MAILTLPLVLVVVLLELAVGGAFLMWILDRTRQAPAGFLKLVAAVNAVAAALAFALLPALPRGQSAEAVRLNTGALESLGLVVPIVLVLLVAQLLAAFLPFRAPRDLTGVGVMLVGSAALLVAAVARPEPEAPYDVFALIALPLGALALGGTNGAMLLGHWYLVTPKLSPAPLQRAALIVAAAIALQAGLVAVTLARGDLLGVDTSLSVAIAIRIGVGIVMTFGLVIAGWWTARMNTQSSTGLLYVGLGTVLAGELAARVIYYLTGAAV